ncbi:MAG: DUF3987 domain-containing protein, partial [Thermomicrobiales bacterium]
RQVLWLQFDADLCDYSGMDQPYFHSMPQDQLNRWIESQQKDVEEVFRSIGLPIHRLDYTGYGLCAYLYLEPIDNLEIQTIKDAHKAFIAAINETSGMKLVDTSASDAGTRITRIPGSWNVKNPNMPREVKTILYDPGSQVTMDQLKFALKRAEQRPQRRPLPSTKELPATTLEEIVKAVAPYWTLGQKHALSLAVSGMFARSGVPEEQALAAVERLSSGDEKPWDRERTVRDSYNRARSGLETLGFYALRDMLPESVLTYIDERLNRFKSAGKGVFRFEAEAARLTSTGQISTHVSTLNIEPVPGICYQGWVGDYVSMMLPLCEAPEQFHLASGLALIGASAGRRVSARYVSKSLYANMYIMIVGVAGNSRKDTAIEFAINMPDRQAGREWNDSPYQVLTDVGSPQGLMSVLQKTPNVWLYVTEYERLAQNAHRSSTSAIFPLLTTAWNTPRKIENVTVGSPIEAKFPYLSTIAAVQPDVLTKEMLPGDSSNGFASRWLFVPGAGRDPMAEPPDIDEEAAHKLYGGLLHTLEKYEKGPNGETRLILSSDAHDRWLNWYDEDGRRPVNSDDEASMKSRLGVHIRKLALIYAASAGAKEISLDHLESGIAFVEWSWIHTRQMMQTWGVPTFNQLEARIEQVLKKTGSIKRRDLQGHCKSRKWGAVEFARVLDVMVKNGNVEVDAEGLHSWAR